MSSRRGSRVAALLGCLFSGIVLGATVSVGSGCCPPLEDVRTGVYLFARDRGAASIGYDLSIEEGRATLTEDTLTVEYHLEDDRSYVATFER